MKSKVRSTDKSRDPIPKAIKILVWNKYVGEDYGKAKCFCCDVTEIRQMSFHCGHIVSVSDGGGTTIDNLRPICQSCNSSMGTTNMIEFMKKHGLENEKIIPKITTEMEIERIKEEYELKLKKKEKELEELNKKTLQDELSIIKTIGLKTVHEKDLLSLVNKALQFEKELLDIFIKENYIMNTKAKKYKKVSIDEFRKEYGVFVYYIYGEDVKWVLEEDSLDRIFFDNIVIEDKGLKISKNGIIKGMKRRE